MSHDDDDFRVTRIRPVKNNQKKNGLDGFVSDLQGMFGKGGSGGGGSGGGKKQSYDQSKWLGPIILLAAIILWGALSSFYTVDISEEAVVTRFGKYHKTSPSGIHYKLPFGIDRIEKVPSKRILVEEFGFRTTDTRGARTQYEKDRYRAESLMLTGDLNVADVEWVLQYRISDPWKFKFHARDVTRNIRDVSMSIMRRVVGDRLVSDVLTTGRIEIAEEARVLTQQVLDSYDIGIKVDKIILQDVSPPERVKPAFNDVNAAKQEQEQTINNAEREYNKVVPEARGLAKKEIANAEAYAIDVVNRAKGDASQFLEVVKEYKKAPDITKKRLYLDTIEQVLANVDGFTVVDSDVKGMLPIYVPGSTKQLPPMESGK